MTHAFAALVSQIAAMKTDAEYREEGMSADDAVETLSALIGQARALCQTEGSDPAALGERRFLVAVERATDAFWSSLAEMYPEAKTGDVAPDVELLFEEAASKAAFHWVEVNYLNNIRPEALGVS